VISHSNGYELCEASIRPEKDKTHYNDTLRNRFAFPFYNLPKNTAERGNGGGI
jgi:hypothetical protein